jgi:glycerol-3-phosphate O-acyltransferase
MRKWVCEPWTSFSAPGYNASVASAEGVVHSEPAWPVAGPRRVVFLVDAASPLERRRLEEWIARRRPEGLSADACEIIPIPPSRRRRRPRQVDPQLESCLAAGDDALLAPLRVAWQPQQRDGVRVARLSDLLTFGDPRDPGRLRQVWVLRRHPDRCCIVAGDPAPVSDLRERWRRAGGTDAGYTTGLPEFVARQATLALERAERRLRGARYKVPRLVHEDILARPAFRGGLARLARELNRPEDAVARDAARYLREIAASHSTYVIDLVAHLIRYMYRRGYGESLHYDHAQLETLYTLAQRHPVVFLPSHKSNLDHLVLQHALHENGHPPNHTAGGINMNFLPMGPLMRRSGVFFIRRTFKDNAVYKFVLRQYIDYLIEKRFPLEWYIEGGRSRSGKLLPPRFGLLAYVVDAYRRGKSEDVFLIPVSIAYDQIQDVGDYVAEQRGAAKQRESFGWFLGMLRRLRRRYGNIHIRFGEPLSLGKALGPPDPAAEPAADEHNLALQKLAFEVAVRINRVTPITPTSLVTLALLVMDRALTVDETVAALHNLVAYVRRRQLPTTAELDLDRPDGVRRALDALVESGVVACYAEGPEAVYAVGPDQHLTAAYYRNTIIHFFVNGAIAELALLRAAEQVAGAQSAAARQQASDAGPGPAAFWDEALRLRDLLKFEFFFADKDAFRREIEGELDVHDAQWRERLAGSAADIQALLRRIRPFSAHRVLRPFLEAYRVVADALVHQPFEAQFDEAAFLSRCLAWGKQYRLQRRIRNTESISKVLFETAVRLARNRNLLAGGGADLAARRGAFALEIRDVVRRVDAIGALAASRFAGLIE